MRVKDYIKNVVLPFCNSTDADNPVKTADFQAALAEFIRINYGRLNLRPSISVDEDCNDLPYADVALEVKAICENVYTTNDYKYAHLYATTVAEYNPIENYNMVEHGEDAEEYADSRSDVNGAQTNSKSDSIAYGAQSNSTSDSTIYGSQSNSKSNSETVGALSRTVSEEMEYGATGTDESNTIIYGAQSRSGTNSQTVGSQSNSSSSSTSYGAQTVTTDETNTAKVAPFNSGTLVNANQSILDNDVVNGAHTDSTSSSETVGGRTDSGTTSESVTTHTDSVDKDITTDAHTDEKSVTDSTAQHTNSISETESLGQHTDSTTGSQTLGAHTDSHTISESMGARTDSSTGSGTKGLEHDLTRKGNIGVTTTQQMLEQERQVALFNLYAIVARDFIKKIAIMVY